MLQALNAFKNQYGKTATFAAACMSMAVTGTILMEWVLDKTKGDVVFVNSVQMPVSLGNKRPRLQMSLEVLRDDCGPIEEVNVTILDKLGVIHGVPTSLHGVQLTKGQKSIITRIEISKLIEPGIVTGSGNMIFECEEGRKFHWLPEWHSIILDPNQKGF